MRINRNKLFLLSIASLPLFGGDLFGMTGTPLMPSPRLFTSPVVMNPPRCFSVSMTVFLFMLFLFAFKDTTTC